MFEDADLIHRYTRADALRDGVLIDVSTTAKEAYAYPPVPWDEFCARYRQEIQAQLERIAVLARRVAAGETSTLLCSSACDEEEFCHRSLLRDLIVEAVARLPPQP